MINDQLLKPRSIVVVGASNDTQKPGGAVLRNLLEHGYRGKIYVTNLKETMVQGIPCYQDLSLLPEADLAIIAIAARFVPEAVGILTSQKNTRAFIVLSAGFSEEGSEGRILEKKLVEIVNQAGATLIGPNCIGVMTPDYAGVFTKPIPVLDPAGCEFISGSGATACFIMEAGIPCGLRFSRVFSVGNSAQLGVEDIVKYLDETFDPKSSSRIKLLYLEAMNRPEMLLKHASSLIRKGCRIAAIKAGTSDAGTRAASSHTGALATPDVAVEALFQKAGIVRCHGREDLVAAASVFQFPSLRGKNMAVISHAGGPAVMLTDTLSQGGLAVPPIDGEAARELLSLLNPGSSVANPIDFLATGNARHLDQIIGFVENRFDHIDGMAVIFGTPGLTKVFNEYDVIDRQMKTCRKPIFPILPSVVTAREEIADFISRGRVFFPDEVVFGRILSAVLHTPPPASPNPLLPAVDKKAIRKVVENAPHGYLDTSAVQALLDAAGIQHTREIVVQEPEAAVKAGIELGYPLVIKVVGPVHKSDVGGVVLNIKEEEILIREFSRLIRIPETTGILIQPMLSGLELFIGAKREAGFGHLILCGMGGIFIEVLKDTAAGLAPLDQDEAVRMIRSLKGYKILQGVRGQQGINDFQFAGIMQKLSALLTAAPEIQELDFNPLLANEDSILVVDSRIKIGK